MTSIDSVRGRCLCGAVGLDVRSPSHRVVACHCRMCRTWGGGPLLAVDGGTDVRIQGAEQVGIYRSSDWAERAFCTACGTHLFYRLVETGDYEIPVGLLESAPAWSLEEEIFIDEKPSYYAFAQHTTELTGTEAMRRYSPDAE